MTQPLYRKLFVDMRQQIEDGTLAEGMALAPERRMAEELGVSRITITKAFDLLKQHGYISRQQGRGTFVTRPPLAPRHAIVFMAATAAHPSLFEVLVGMAPVINRARGMLRIMGSFEGLGDERDMLERAIADGAGGLIVYPGPEESAAAIYSSLATLGVPTVMIDRRPQGVATDAVVYDDHAAAETLCHRLFAEGARRIAVLPHYEVDVSSVQDRLAGARAAAAAHDLPPDAIAFWPDIFAEFRPSETFPGPSLDELSLLRERLTSGSIDAFFAINGDVAERLAQALALLLPDVPSLAHLRLAACTHKPLLSHMGRSIDVALENPQELGRAAAEMLTKRLASGIGRPEVQRIPMLVRPAGHLNGRQGSG